MVLASASASADADRSTDHRDNNPKDTPLICRPLEKQRISNEMSGKCLGAQPLESSANFREGGVAILKSSNDVRVTRGTGTALFSFEACGFERDCWRLHGSIGGKACARKHSFLAKQRSTTCVAYKFSSNLVPCLILWSILAGITRADL